MKKLFFLLTISGLILFAIHTNAQQVIATSGGYYENENISLSWTVGEPVIETFTAGDVILTQGFQQPWSFYLQQILNIPMGWSGISGYIDPLNKGVEGIFSPWENDLIILASMTGMYWPETGINTIVNWDYHTGYQVKALNDFDLTLTGTKIADPTVSIPSGWSLLPVLVACETPVETLFSDFPGLTIVKQVAGVNLYWPAYNINTLGNLIPGKAYFVAASGDGQVTFPACTKSKYVAQPPAKLLNNTPWNDLTPTSASHAVAFPANILTESGLLPGDVIGVLTTDGTCAGQAELIQSAAGLALVAFGNDEITAGKEGFDFGEMFDFRIFRSDTGEEMLLEVDFDPSLPNMASFAPNGLSAIKSMKVQSLGVDEVTRIQISIFPNPSNGVFNLSMSFWPEKNQIQLLDARGQVIKFYEFDRKPNGHSQTFDISHLPKGVYFLKINGGGLAEVRKIVMN